LFESEYAVAVSLHQGQNSYRRGALIALTYRARVAFHRCSSRPTAEWNLLGYSSVAGLVRRRYGTARL